MAKAGIGLIYGGGGAGMMGAVARAVLENGGQVTGIIPEFLTRREHALQGEHELIVTADMHERKRKMFEMADAFVAMPGGVGTLEELVEQANLGAARPPQKADPHRRRQRLLAAALRPARPHEGARIHPPGTGFRVACRRQGRRYSAETAESDRRCPASAKEMPPSVARPALRFSVMPVFARTMRTRPARPTSPAYR